jgi:hypothetical protein
MSSFQISKISATASAREDDLSQGPSGLARAVVVKRHVLFVSERSRLVYTPSYCVGETKHQS